MKTAAGETRRLRRVVHPGMAIYVKAFSLVLKTASKPLAKQLKHLATSNATLRAWCIAAALRVDAVYQGVMSPTDDAPHLSSGGRRMKIDKSSRPRIMNEEQALSAATDFLGEAFVFAVAGWLVWWEQDKSAQKDAAKTTKAAEERAQLTELLAVQQRSMRDMVDVLGEFERYRRATTAKMEELERRANNNNNEDGTTAARVNPG